MVRWQRDGIPRAYQPAKDSIHEAGRFPATRTLHGLDRFEKDRSLRYPCIEKLVGAKPQRVANHGVGFIDRT